MTENEARKLMGQVFALRMPGRSESLDLQRFPVANYIVFGSELESALKPARRKLECWRERLHGHGITPLLMVDEEGGRVSQIDGFFPAAPSPRAVAGCLTPGQAQTLYEGVSAALEDLGIDMNLFPCLDVNTEALNPVIGTRSFGITADEVTRFGLAAIRGTSTRTASAAKHFPGHGMTRTDSHLGLPTVDTPEAVLRAIHLQPFAEAVRVGIDAVMISHCHYRDLESERQPASLSAAIVEGLLRKDLGYSGMVLTDSLDMDAVAAHFAAPVACTRALGAGCDLLLFTEYSERFAEAFDTLVADLLSGRLAKKPVEASAERRSSLLGEVAARRRTKRHTGGDSYANLRDLVIAGSIHVERGRSVLPLACGEIALVTTSADIVPRIGERRPVRIVPTHTNAPPTIPLVLWLTEPLRLDRSIASLKTLASQSDRCILVTNYEALGDLLRGSDTVIIAHDSSTYTEDLIIDLLFGTGPSVT